MTTPRSEPTQTCTTCNRVVVVKWVGRGFPPDMAKRKLARLCAAAGHVSVPQYRAGVLITPPRIDLKLQEGPQ